MRRFYSYGPVNCKHHFCVERQDMIAYCTEQLIGDPEEGGHYFTIWAPRQTGKTWLMRQVKEEIETRYGDQFIIGTMSVQGLIMEDDDPDDVFFRYTIKLFRESFRMKPAQAQNWGEWTDFFSIDEGLFD